MDAQWDGVGGLVTLRTQDLTISSETVKKELPKYWEREYIHECLERVENQRHRMLFTFLWMTGCRITEAVSLKKENIDLVNYTVRLRWLKSRKYRERYIPLHPRIRDILQVFTAPLKADERLFPLSRERAWQLCRKHFNGHPHQFRHSFAVNWLRCGGDLVVLHRVLGHARIQTTMEYLKIVPTDQGKELLKIEL